jgi:hypothetical protein
LPFTLDVVRGHAAGGRLDIPASGLTVGREALPPAELDGDPALSREHARFIPSGDGNLVVEDLHSTNGTLVNGRRIAEPTPARPGDVIQVGATVLRVLARPAAELEADDGRMREALFAWLSRDSEGRRLLARLETDPDGAARPLAEWIRTRQASAPSQLATYVAGGHVERLVNIANARDVHIHEPPKQLWDKVANARGAPLLFLLLGIGAVVGGFASFAYPAVTAIGQGWSRVRSGDSTPPDVQIIPWVPLGMGLMVVGVVMVVLAVGASARDRRAA